jgi:hypothetical protein
MSKKLTLKIDYSDDLDFSLTGISCGHKDYRLCFDLNMALDIDMERTDDLILPLQRPGASTIHSCFMGIGSEGEMYYLISNRDKNGAGFFVPEHRNLGYFFVIAGEGGKYLRETVVETIRDIQIVEAAFDVPPSSIKGADAFTFLLEF